MTFLVQQTLIYAVPLMIVALAGVFAFSSFWTIKELFEQQERVRKGWFPANPKRRTKQACRTEEEKR